MASEPLLPFQADVASADGVPYRLRLSQGFNEALYYGSGLPQDQALGQRIQAMMAHCTGEAGLAHPREAFLARLMALSYHIEYLAIALMGDTLALSDHRAFLASLQALSAEVQALGNPNSTDPTALWATERLRDAQFRFHQRFGLPPPAEAPVYPTGPVQRPQTSPWTSLPHTHLFLLNLGLPPLAAS
jgi:hypothetical protein